MTERPILFSAPMVRAILDGRKTQTRRVMKPQPVPNPSGGHWWSCAAARSMLGVEDFLQDRRDWTIAGCASPYGCGTLWVRETFCPMGPSRPAGYWTDPKWKGRECFYASDNDRPLWAGKWRPSIFMPRALSRITLAVTDVRVQRVQSMTQEDAVDEGCEGHHGKNGGMFVNPLEAYAALWDSLNAKRGFGWESNPWVWAITFRRLP